MGPLCRVTSGGTGLPPLDTGVMCGGVVGMDSSTTNTWLFDSTWVAWGAAPAHPKRGAASLGGLGANMRDGWLAVLSPAPLVLSGRDKRHGRCFLAPAGLSGAKMRSPAPLGSPLGVSGVDGRGATSTSGL